MATGLVTNKIDVNFDGFGMIFGVDGERRSPCTGLMVYGKALTSFLGGDWRAATYNRTSSMAASWRTTMRTIESRPFSSWSWALAGEARAADVVPTLGYMTSAWYDAISTRQYVDAVRNNNYISIDETITFSGLTAGIEADF